MAAAAANPTSQQYSGNNVKIIHAREVALAALKPSPKDLEHGLELHANSVVFDAYGFAPTAAPDGNAVRTAIEAGASDIELQDMQEEMSMTRFVTDPSERKEYEEAWRASGVTCVYQNSGQEGMDPMRLIKRLARFTYVTDMMPEFVKKVVNPDEVVLAKKQDMRCLCFTGNGIPIAQQWVSVEDELRYIRVFYQLGIRMMHLTYNRRNLIGDGCGEATDAGLSDFGRAAVKEMNRVGVLPDCAHSGWQTGLDAAKASSRPVVASHSAADAVFHHYRSKPDRPLRALADSGGYCGVCCIPRFLGHSSDVVSLLNHVDYIAKKFGAAAVAIGTDSGYRSRAAAAEAKKIPATGPKRTAWEMLWPPDPTPFKTEPSMTESMLWTNWPLFTVGLVQRGYSDQDIQKIIGGNVLRVARTTRPDEGTTI